MVTKFSVFGSCSCRDIFYSKINKNYKNYFEIGKSGVRISFISLMSDAVNYNSDSLKIHPINQQNKNLSNWIKIDLDKSFLNDLVQDEDIEYLMIDTFYDVNWGIFDLGDGKFITNNLGLDKTNFFKQLKYCKKLTIFDDFEEYYELWTYYCDLFFDFLNNNCPSIKIILNPSRHVFNVLRSDGSTYMSEDFKKQCAKYNIYRDILDEYILTNYDVDVLDFDENTLIDENHIWGKFSVHYEPYYYQDMTNQLNEIIKRNNSSNGAYDFNKEIRKNKREKILQKIRFNKQFQDINNKIINLNGKLDEKEEMIEEYKDKLKNSNDELIDKKNEIIRIESGLNLKDSKIQNIESKLVNEQNNLNTVKKQLTDTKQEILSLKKNELELNEQLNNKEEIIHTVKQQNLLQLSKIDNNEYCITCFKEEITNNHMEIDYLKKNALTKKVLTPFSYLYLILKSRPKELSLNFKLYRALKDSECFDIGFYLNKNKDLQGSNWCKYFSPELHYICNGFYEERLFNKKYFNRNSKKELLNYILTCEKNNNS